MISHTWRLHTACLTFDPSCRVGHRAYVLCQQHMVEIFLWSLFEPQSWSHTRVEDTRRWGSLQDWGSSSRRRGSSFRCPPCLSDSLNLQWLNNCYQNCSHIHTCISLLRFDMIIIILIHRFAAQANHTVYPVHYVLLYLHRHKWHEQEQKKKTRNSKEPLNIWTLFFAVSFSCKWQRGANHVPDL